MFIINAGMSSKNYESIKKEIFNQMEDMKNGSFTIKDINDAREVILSIINEINDNPWAIIDHYINNLYFKTDSLSKQKNEFKKVTKDSVVSVAKKISIDTIFLLKEDENEEISNK